MPPRNRMIWRLCVLMFMTLLTAGALSVRAQDAGNESELGLQLGYGFPVGRVSDSSLNLSNSDLFHGSFRFAFDGYYPFADWWSSGLEFGYSTGHRFEGDVNGLAFTSNVHLKVLQITPVLKCGRYFRAGSLTWKPYGVIGAGYYRTWSNSGTVTVQLDDSSVSAPMDSSSTNLFGVNGGGGIALRLSETVELAAEARYHRIFSDDSRPLHPTDQDFAYVVPSVRLAYLFP